MMDVIASQLSWVMLPYLASRATQEDQLSGREGVREKGDHCMAPNLEFTTCSVSVCDTSSSVFGCGVLLPWRLSDKCAYISVPL